MAAAAQNLTPVVLELGGKSPCIVDETADLPVAAARIIWGKCLNSGQTCVAPDYVLVARSCKDALIREMQKAICRFYGEDPCENSAYPGLSMSGILTGWLPCCRKIPLWADGWTGNHSRLSRP